MENTGQTTRRKVGRPKGSKDKIKRRSINVDEEVYRVQQENIHLHEENRILKEKLYTVIEETLPKITKDLHTLAQKKKT
jgi:hypothetical protein